MPLQGGPTAYNPVNLEGQMGTLNLSSTQGGVPVHPQAPMTAPLLTNNLPAQHQPPPPLFGQQQQPPPLFNHQQQPPPLFAQQQPPLLQNSVTPSSGYSISPQNMAAPPTALPPNLPTIMSTSAVGYHQPTTLMASTESSVPLYSTPSQPQSLPNGGYQMATSQPQQPQLFTGAPPQINNGSPSQIQHPIAQPMMQPPPPQMQVPPQQMQIPPQQMQIPPQQQQQQPVQTSITPQVNESFTETKPVPLMTDISLDASPQMVQQIPTQPPVVGDQGVQLS